MNKIDSALEVMSLIGDRLVRDARGRGDVDTAFAFEAVANMLTSMAHRYTSPLLEAKYSTLIKVGNGYDYDQAQDRAIAYAFWRMRTFNETQYKASQVAAEASIFHPKRIAQFLPREVDSPEGQDLAIRLDHLIAQLDERSEHGEKINQIEDFEWQLQRLGERSRRWERNVDRLVALMAEKGKTFEGRPFIDPACFSIGLNDT